MKIISKKIVIISFSLIIVLSIVVGFLGNKINFLNNSSSTRNQTQSGEKRISVVCMSLNSIYWKMVEKGAKDAGEKFGVNVTVMGPVNEAQTGEQLKMIEDSINENTSSLVVSPSQPIEAVSLFNTAKDKNIPVVLFNSYAAFDDKVSFVGTKNLEAGIEGGTYLANLLNKGSKVAIIRGLWGNKTHDERCNGAIEAFTSANINVVDIQSANSDRFKAKEVMENILQSNPDIEGIYTTTDEMAIGAISALENKGILDKVKVVSFDESIDSLECVLDGKIAALIAQSPYKMGYKGVESAVKAIKGEKVDKTIDTGVTIVTKENAKDHLRILQELK